MADSYGTNKFLMVENSEICWPQLKNYIKSEPGFTKTEKSWNILNYIQDIISLDN